MWRADSMGATRTRESGEADSGVPQNRVRKHLSSVGEESPRARPDPRQREMLLPLPSMREVASSSAQSRLAVALSAHLAPFGARFATQTRSEITPELWARAIAIEQERPGQGLPHVLEALGPAPPATAAAG